MPTEVGWRTQYLNWRRGLPDDMGIDPEWIEINWWKPGGAVERIPGLPAGVKARVRSQVELHEGLSKGPFDALFVGVGHVLHGGGRFLTRQPYFITTDVTPRQLHAFGDLYGIRPSRMRLYEKQKHLGWRERYQNAAAIFACSEWTADSLIGDYGVDPSRVYVVPPGVDTTAWHFPAREPHDGPVNILFVGGDFHRKGGDLLLDWARMTKHRSWNLHIVTRDEVPTDHPQIHVHHGLTSNDPALMALYEKADIFALPTRGDCYSLAGMEAMAAGLPVILSRTGGTADIIRDGETGYLIGAGDGGELATRLDDLLGDPRKRYEMGRAARTDAVARFDSVTNIRRTLGVMRSLVKGDPMPAEVSSRADAGGDGRTRTPSREKRLHVGFVMSTEVGWKTQYLNWRAGLTEDMGIDPEWIVINWWDEGGLIEHLPVMPPGVKARLRSHLELRRGLRSGTAAGPLDALFVGVGHVLHGSGKLLARQPYFITSDVTPKQLHEFGALYGIMRTRLGFYERRKFQGWRTRYQGAAALFPWSRWAARSMIEDYGAAPNRVHVVPPGVDVRKWSFPERDPEKSSLDILFVGGDFHRKGGDLLLEWARRTSAKGWTLHLVTRDAVAGLPDNVRVYDQLSPNDPALMELYRNADLFVLPTRGDCYSIASIEAMAAGLPVILSRIGGTEDIIEDGRTGFLIDPGSPGQLADRLECLIERRDLRQALGIRARAEAVRRYDANKNIRQTLSIVRECVGLEPYRDLPEPSEERDAA